MSRMKNTNNRRITNKLRKPTRMEWLFVAAAFVVLFVTLMLPPVIGVADNGDFVRLMSGAGIGYLDPKESYRDRYFGYAHTEYGYGPFQLGRYVSLQVLLVLLAGGIGRLIDSSVFDIRVLSAIYSLLFLAALYLIVKHYKQQSAFVNAVLFAVLAFIFLDVGYIAYFNSFFGEPVTLIFMLMTFGAAAAIVRSDKPSGWLLVLFFAAGAFVACTKLQNAPIGLLIMLLGLRLGLVRSDRKWRRGAWCGVAALLLASVVMYAAAPQGFKHINLYQSIFFGILKDSPHPERDLEELGLPAKFIVNAGTNYFQKDAPIKQNDPEIAAYLDRMSHKDVVLYYLKHPGRFVQKMEQGAKNGMMIRPYYLGNFDKTEGKPYGALSMKYSGWSEFKRTVLPSNLLFLSLFYLAYFAVLAAEYVRSRERRGRLFIELFAAIGLIGLCAFAVPLVGDGEADLGKHLFLFNVCFDMMAAATVVYIAAKAVKVVRR
ncbi:hypothetical protein ACFSL6_00945 [Paenibacillus thailandensis]|uniref:Glycosyltransferase RgtA/B/C/D-like domain-containing protein n=1 Tax=Paenibacillus thailandensis TaxID=393250 RepID=A0ABW5QVC9_9BACL